MASSLRKSAEGVNKLPQVTTTTCRLLVVTETLICQFLRWNQTSPLKHHLYSCSKDTTASFSPMRPRFHWHRYSLSDRLSLGNIVKGTGMILDILWVLLDGVYSHLTSVSGSQSSLRLHAAACRTTVFHSILSSCDPSVYLQTFVDNDQFLFHTMIHSENASLALLPIDSHLSPLTSLGMRSRQPHLCLTAMAASILGHLLPS